MHSSCRAQPVPTRMRAGSVGTYLRRRAPGLWRPTPGRQRAADPAGRPGPAVPRQWATYLPIYLGINYNRDELGHKDLIPPNKTRALSNGLPGPGAPRLPPSLPGHYTYMRTYMPSQ